jgi:hypothetical protein
MGQHDYVVANDTGANVRADLNLALAAIVSQNSGASAPSTTFAYMFWADTTTGLLKQRDSTNASWITLGTMASANLGLLPLSGGTLTGILLALAGGAVGTPDIAWAGDTDTGLYRAGANLLGLVANGVELLRVDGVLGYIKLLSTAGLLVPSGTTGQRPTGVAGIMRYNSTLNQFEGYNGTVWGGMGGGGGGGGITWRGLGGTAPTEAEEYGELSWLFAQVLAQELYSTIVVPQTYSAGSPIKLYTTVYSPSSSNTQLMKAVATLIRPGTTAFDSTTNQRTTTNAAITNTVAKQALTHTLDVTDTSGQINSVAVAAGDIIKVKLYRDNSDTDTADLRVLKSGFDLKFS